MAKKAYTTKLKSAVYHTKKSCTVGNNIEKANVKKGTGRRRKCTRCK